MIDRAGMRKKMPAGKALRLGVLIALFAYIIWLAWKVSSFKEYEANPEKVRESAVGHPDFEVEGVYHVHSRFSDGHATVDEIARTASRERVDFVLLTDHGNPNEKALEAQARKDRVMIIAGTELSVNRGHLVALGFERPDKSQTFARDAEGAALQVAALGGFTIIAHPYSKTRWSWGKQDEFDGLEIMDMDSMAKGHFLGALPYLPALLIRPKLALLKMIRAPEQTLRKWDELLRRRPVLGFFSSDAHFLYGPLFGIFHLHVVLDRPLAEEFEAAKRQILDSIRAGRFFSAVDAAAAARGFRLSLQDGALRVATPFSFAHETVIIRDGRAIFRSRDSALAFSPLQPGVYRIEVYLREKSPLAPDVPWIISNPITYGDRK